MRKVLAAAALFAGLAGAAHAQDQSQDAICADRPGKATPACIVDTGHLQLETGLADATLARDHGLRDDVFVMGQTELRYGLSRWTELEAIVTPLSLEHATGAPRLTGFGDMALGIRTALTDPGAKDHLVSFEPFVTAPTATHHQGAGGWEAGGRLPMSANLEHGFSLGVTPEADLRRDADGHGRHLALSAAASLGHALPGIDSVSIAAELWGERDDDPTGHVDQASFDLSAAWQPNNDLQLDVGANAGLTRATPDLELYVGVARRF